MGKLREESNDDLDAFFERELEHIEPDYYDVEVGLRREDSRLVKSNSGKVTP